MEHTDLLIRFGVALLIGVLIGLERECARLKEDAKAFAGVRTLPLIALLGCSAALLADVTGAWVFVAIVGLVGVLIAIALAIDAYQGKVGMSTEIAGWWFPPAANAAAALPCDAGGGCGRGLFRSLVQTGHWLAHARGFCPTRAESRSCRTPGSVP